MKVLARDNLRTVAFKVCSVLHEVDVTAVLTGGSAATVYAPKAYQSKDLDFLLQFKAGDQENSEEALEKLGYVPDSGQYVRHSEKYLEFNKQLEL